MFTGLIRLRGKQSGNPPCLMAPAGPWELAFFLASGLIFRAQARTKKMAFFWSFLVVFLRFLVVISRFLGVFALRDHYFARSAIFFGFISPTGP